MYLVSLLTLFRLKNIILKLRDFCHVVFDPRISLQCSGFLCSAYSSERKTRQKAGRMKYSISNKEKIKKNFLYVSKSTSFPSYSHYTSVVL